MRFEFFRGPQATDARRRALRRLLLGALVLTAVLGALQLRSAGSARLQGEDLQRQRAVAQATALLSAVSMVPPSTSTSVPAPLPALPSPPVGQATVAPDANEPQRGQPPITPPDIPSTLPPLQRFAKATAHERLPPSLLASYAMSDNAGNAGAWDLPPAESTASGGAARMRANAGAGAPRRPIPDRIEGTAPSRRDTDALVAVTIDSGLRLVDERDAPFRLSEVRNTPGAARAHFAPRDGNPSYPVPAGWLEVGESPINGWRIVRIESGAVVLLTPAGNPMRLRVAGGADVPTGAGQTSGQASGQASRQTYGATPVVR
jgi:hypothetical protein